MTRRFQINPEPLRIVAGRRLQEDYDAGRCKARQANGLRCANDARYVWSATPSTRELLCGVHARGFKGSPYLKELDA